MSFRKPNSVSSENSIKKTTRENRDIRSPKSTAAVAEPKRARRSPATTSAESSSCIDQDLRAKQPGAEGGVDQVSSNTNNGESGIHFCPSSSVKSMDEVIALCEKVVEQHTSTGMMATVSTGVILRPVTDTEKPVTHQPRANSIVVSPKQRGNPILKFVRNVPWEFGDIVPDYQFSPTSCCLFLSVRYHNLKPNYVHERLRQLANSYVLRVLLVHVDVKECDYALKELAKICILADCTMVLAFTAEEAGRYIETYKSFENKPAEMLMEKTDNNYMAKVTDTVTAIKKINKTDAATLISAFGSFKKVVEATEQDLSFCPGMGPQKATRLLKVFHQPFLKDPKRPIAADLALKAAASERKPS